MDQQHQEPQPINDMNAMAELVMKWFHNRHQQLTYLTNLPEHDELEVMDQDTGEVIKLTGEQRKFFIMGIAVAQSTFIDPPFKAVEADEEQPTA